MGRQFVRAADSVGANLVEGDGRYSHAEGVHFFLIARGSARETRYWLKLASERQLIEASRSETLTKDIHQATRQLNGLIRFRRSKQSQPNTVAESHATYVVQSEDPFADPDLNDLTEDALSLVQESQRSTPNA